MVPGKAGLVTGEARNGLARKVVIAVITALAVGGSMFAASAIADHFVPAAAAREEHSAIRAEVGAVERKTEATGAELDKHKAIGEVQDRMFSETLRRMERKIDKISDQRWSRNRR